MASTRCTETTDGQHRWDSFTIPSRTHDADGTTSTTPARAVRECMACGEQGPDDADRLCIYCESNPAEPGHDCCDNGFCKAEAIAERAG